MSIELSLGLCYYKDKVITEQYSEQFNGRVKLAENKI